MKNIATKGNVLKATLQGLLEEVVPQDADSPSSSCKRADTCLQSLLGAEAPSLFVEPESLLTPYAVRGGACSAMRLKINGLACRPALAALPHMAKSFTQSIEILPVVPPAGIWRQERTGHVQAHGKPAAARDSFFPPYLPVLSRTPSPLRAQEDSYSVQTKLSSPGIDTSSLVSLTTANDEEISLPGKLGSGRAE